MKTGKITVLFNQGKIKIGYGILQHENGLQPYIDYTQQPYPSSWEMKNATSIIFTSDTGEAKAFKEWKYLFNYKQRLNPPRILVDSDS